ncbi:MAG: glutaminyl-tRNA synthase (glutamine-hydrolyzing) subunit B [Chlamydiae bacterium RIFCSPHIGHO2_12_FULL_49_11]|nr:MAG: glutaminyl-tRNA synthase (glutamine-hydrolyzing) subunit B [Chlamydiae bacterium RIFCSPHIGHO2_12_FULL_49_11]
MKGFEPVIGLEIHMQLNTKSKMFSPEANRFGDEPNTNVGFVDLAIPGALPVINREAVNKAILFGLATRATIETTSYFDRKSYFYPDNPAGYQITQFYKPLLVGGQVETLVDGEKKTFAIEHTHLENDAGKLIHFPNFAGVDFNRAGAPLIEIVSHPCMHSAKDATAYATAILAIAEYLDITEGNLQEGCMRMDVNISVRKIGEHLLRKKAEIKNLNSFHNMELAIEAEVARQIAFYEDHPDGSLESGTYRFDLERRQTVLMRRKETADDYRYFPEPDLPPLVITREEIDRLAQRLPELPQERYRRYVETLGLSPYNANVLIHNRRLCLFFEEGLRICKNAVSLCNWVTVEFGGRANERSLAVDALGIPARHIAELVNAVDDGRITGKMAKEIADMMMTSPNASPLDIIVENPRFRPISDTNELDAVIATVLEKHPQSVLDYKNGKDRAFQFLIGMVMRETKGQANPEIVRDLLLKKIEMM